MRQINDIYISLLENPNAENYYLELKNYYSKSKNKKLEELFDHLIKEKFRNENSNNIQKQ